jgi:hypothetical protein
LFILECLLENINDTPGSGLTMTTTAANRKNSSSLWMQYMPKGFKMQLEGFEERRYVWKDNLFKVARHVTVFQVSKNGKSVHVEPMLHRRRMLFALWPIEGRVADSVVRTIKMSADEEKNKKY